MLMNKIERKKKKQKKTKTEKNKNKNKMPTQKTDNHPKLFLSKLLRAHKISCFA